MYTYQEERYTDVIEEMKPLLEDHYEEIALYKEHIKLNPAYDAYEMMAAAGMLHIFTARIEETNELVGYTVTFLQYHPHYKDHKYAVNDIIFVKPEHRHGEVAPEMLDRLEALMLADDVSVMTFHMKTYKTFETLMDSLGYNKAEYIFSKYIKESGEI